jgi:hypothetical protein
MPEAAEATIQAATADAAKQRFKARTRIDLLTARVKALTATRMERAR